MTTTSLIPNPTLSSDENSGSSNVAALAGGVIGGVAGLAVLLALLFLALRACGRRHRRTSLRSADMFDPRTSLYYKKGTQTGLSDEMNEVSGSGSNSGTGSAGNLTSPGGRDVDEYRSPASTRHRRSSSFDASTAAAPLSLPNAATYSPYGPLDGNPYGYGYSMPPPPLPQQPLPPHPQSQPLTPAQAARREANGEQPRTLIPFPPSSFGVGAIDTGVSPSPHPHAGRVRHGSGSRVSNTSLPSVYEDPREEPGWGPQQHAASGAASGASATSLSLPSTDSARSYGSGAWLAGGAAVGAPPGSDANTLSIPSASKAHTSLGHGYPATAAASALPPRRSRSLSHDSHTGRRTRTSFDAGYSGEWFERARPSPAAAAGDSRASPPTPSPPLWDQQRIGYAQ